MKDKTVFPRVKWIYDDLSKYSDEKQFFVKIRSTFLWRFYFRFVQAGYGWFTPCNDCQRIIERVWRSHVKGFNFTHAIVKKTLCILCDKCQKSIKNHLNEQSLSFDNSRLEIELSRSWVKGKKDEDNIEVSFDEWKENLNV